MYLNRTNNRSNKTLLRLVRFLMHQTLFLPKSWKGAITLNPAPTALAKGKTDKIGFLKVTQSQKQITVSSILQKIEQKITIQSIF